MKSAEIKKNILNIATDVFRDTPVFFAYLYGSYAVDQAHPFSDLDIGNYQRTYLEQIAAQSDTKD